MILAAPFPQRILCDSVLDPTRHMNARNSLCDHGTTKTLQSLQTFTAISHTLPPATRLLISLSSSHTVKTLCSLHRCSCNTADLVVPTGPAPSRLMLQGTGFQGSQLAGGAGTQPHLKMTFRQQANKFLSVFSLALFICNVHLDSRG